ELLEPLRPARLIPDAYFQIKRPVDSAERTSAFFVEVERSIKSARVISDKLERYYSFITSRAYPRIFGTRALRILFLFTDQYGIPTHKRVQQALATASGQQMSLARFSTITALKHTSPSGTLLEPLWYQAASTSTSALFQ